MNNIKHRERSHRTTNALTRTKTPVFYIFHGFIIENPGLIIQLKAFGLCSVLDGVISRDQQLTELFHDTFLYVLYGFELMLDYGQCLLVPSNVAEFHGKSEFILFHPRLYI